MFFAYLNRMKYIERWGLMRSTVKENIMEHSYQTAAIAHCLALINNKIFKGSADAEKTVMLALYHEVSEVITGDLPTPIKYHNAKIKTAFSEIEKLAEEKLLAMLPKEFAEDYKTVVMPDTESIEYKLMKGADKLAAYIKCIEETNSGNKEFAKAKSSIKEIIEKHPLEEVKYFYEKFIPGYGKTLDELD
jgi:5'-deoxynucleotidase